MFLKAFLNFQYLLVVSVICNLSMYEFLTSQVFHTKKYVVVSCVLTIQHGKETNSINYSTDFFLRFHSDCFVPSPSLSHKNTTNSLAIDKTNNETCMLYELNE